MASDGSVMTFKGRGFGSDELEEIRDVVSTFGRLSRQELANTVCELLDWRRPNGGLKTTEARELLERLEASGQIELPAASRRGRPRGSKTKILHRPAGQPQRELLAQLRDVGPVQRRLVETAEPGRRARELVEPCHAEGGRVRG